MSQLPKLVQARLYAPPTQAHPDVDVLTAFCEQALPNDERQTVLNHLAKCDQCREVAALALPPQESAASADLRNEPAWMRGGWIRWASLAACLVVVGAAVMLRPKTGPAFAPAGTEDGVVLPQQRQATQSDKAAAKVAINGVETKEAGVSAGAPKPPAAPLSPALTAPKSNPAAKARPARVVASPPAEDKSGGAASGQVPETRKQKQSAGLQLNGRNFTQLVTLPPDAQTRDARKLEYRQNAPQTGFVAPVAPPPASASQTVEVSGATTEVSVLEQPAEIGRAKAAPAAAAKAQTGQDEANSVDALKKSDGVRMLGASTGEPVHWMLQLPQGQLERSFDGGATWEPAPVVNKTKFTAFSVAGQDVWAGGASGLLFHSADGGTHWTLMKPTIDGVALAADINALHFTDSDHGTLSTSDGQTWMTGDGGKNWSRK
jgi:hypothetical protein